MRVAIVHYHLKSGGVTRVIANALQSLAQRDVDVLVISGEEPESVEAISHAKIAVVPGLNYRQDSTPGAGKQLYQELCQAAKQHWGRLPDIWHWHNHSLGKNVHAPDIVQRLAASQDSRLLLQMHDFTEDGRPYNFRCQLNFPYPLYPQAAHIHYAVLNGRDAAVLSTAGWPSERLHLLPNAVALEELRTEEKPLAKPAGFDRLFLYPTRAIRRKNLGEICLHALFADAGTGFATTLLPRNPEWQRIHKDWQRLAQRLKLPIRFGVGEAHDTSFEQWIHSAQALVTTSIAEGFGLAFLEPYQMDKPVRGRDLPEITVDFKANGLELSELYTECRIPHGLIDLGWLRDAVERSVTNSCAAFGLDPESTLSQSVCDSIADEAGIEFGRLNEKLQQSALGRLYESPCLRSQWQPPRLDLPFNPDLQARNKRCIQTHYSLSAYGERLYKLYSQLEASEPAPIESSIDPHALVREFLSPKRYSLLRD